MMIISIILNKYYPIPYDINKIMYLLISIGFRQFLFMVQRYYVGINVITGVSVFYIPQYRKIIIQNIEPKKKKLESSF
jgi:hypothetical protein